MELPNTYSIKMDNKKYGTWNMEHMLWLRHSSGVYELGTRGAPGGTKWGTKRGVYDLSTTAGANIRTSKC